MSVIPQASLFLGIIPALALLYLSLKDYQDLFKEKTMFLVFVIGIISGFIAAFVQSITLPLSIVYIVLLGFFDQLIKTMILNVRSLQMKKETPIYGLTLGLGFGSAFTPFIIIAVSSTIVIQNNSVLAAIAIGSVGIIMFHGATGAYIGYGVYKGTVFKNLIYAIILHIPFSILLDLSIKYSNAGHLTKTLVGLVGCIIIYGGIVYWYVYKNIMPQIKTTEEKRKRTNKKTD